MEVSEVERSRVRRGKVLPLEIESTTLLSDILLLRSSLSSTKDHQLCFLRFIQQKKERES